MAEGCSKAATDKIVRGVDNPVLNYIYIDVYDFPD